MLSLRWHLRVCGCRLYLSCMSLYLGHWFVKCMFWSSSHLKATQLSIVSSLWQGAAKVIFTRGQFWPSGIVIACVCGSVCPCVCMCVCVYQSRACPHDNSSPIQARITKFGPEMQNTLVWVPIVLGDDRPWSSRSNLTWKSNFTPFWACSHHYSSAIQARITKFGPKMHLSTVKVPTNFGLDWFWSSLSFSILKPIFLPNKFAPFLYIFSETHRL